MIAGNGFVEINQADLERHIQSGMDRSAASRTRLHDLEAFVAVVEKGSQTAAAHHLERAPARLHIVACAAKTYLQRHGRPRHPHELARHACVVRTLDGSDEPWHFVISPRRSGDSSTCSSRGCSTLRCSAARR